MGELDRMVASKAKAIELADKVIVHIQQWDELEERTYRTLGEINELETMEQTVEGIRASLFEIAETDEPTVVQSLQTMQVLMIRNKEIAETVMARSWRDKPIPISPAMQV